jgi:hypothetical protein
VAPKVPASVRFRTQQEIRDSAEDLLLECFGEVKVPVDIELLAECHLHFEILPIAGLEQRFGLDGYTSEAGIAVDALAWRLNTNRYRFTLAHEVGHHVLHGDLISSVVSRKPGEYLHLHPAIPDANRKRYEWQAHQFAALLLMPGSPLADLVEAGLAAAAESGNPIDLSELSDCKRLAKWIGDKARVSAEVVMRRAIEEGHWAPYR